ncbi:MAG: hypothetical protein ACYC3I_18790 [Gemmataceae bacterium]
MLPRLFRFIAAVVLALSMALPSALGQASNPPPPNAPLESVERGVKVDPADSANSGPPSYALPYFTMAIFTMLILSIMCMPSRKA